MSTRARDAGRAQAMDELPPNPAAARRARWGRRLVHALLIAFGWGLFAWSWQRVTADRPEVGELRVLMVVAVLLVPVLTLWWVAHNVGIYRRKGPRRAVAAVSLHYEQDFNGHRIRADWSALQGARRIEIFVEGGDKRFIAAARPPGVVEPVQAPRIKEPA